MEQLHTSTVTRDQIDHLGHMNVRFYAALAGTGASKLMERIGLRPGEEVEPWQSDVYVRHHREQLEGARLEVTGGVLGVEARGDSCGLRLYEELTNSDSGELAAAFVITVSPVFPGEPGEGNGHGSFPEEVVAEALQHMVEVPEHGCWRSISFDDDPVAQAPPLAELQARDLAMREIREIADFESDQAGRYRSDLMPDLVWGGAAIEGRGFQPFHEAPSGETMAWATMETRATWARLPRVGDKVQTFGAELTMTDKTMLTRNWVYDVESGEIVCVFSILNLAFGLESRRSMPIPAAAREGIQEFFHPDLASSRGVRS